jgi:hypothetical protein
MIEEYNQQKKKQILHENQEQMQNHQQKNILKEKNEDNKNENKINFKENEKEIDLKLLFNLKYNETERSKILNLLNYTSEWLYSPINEELENKLYFIDLDKNKNKKENEDEDEDVDFEIYKKNKQKENKKIFDIEDFFSDNMYYMLYKDLEENNNNNNKDINSSNKSERNLLNRKYGLLINNKI